jgi:hypothetical protein
VEHAEGINDLAKHALRLETRDATYLARKISLGLSLQAIELAGKGILFSLGETTPEIRRKHKWHKLPDLLRAAESALQARTEEAFRKHDHFTLWAPTIDGVEFATTVAAYLEKHFSRGASAKPRNYFYPDKPVYTGPQPIHAIWVIADHLIQVAAEIESLVESTRTQQGTPADAKSRAAER